MIETSTLDKASIADSSASMDSAADCHCSMADMKRGYGKQGGFATDYQQVSEPSGYFPLTDPWGEPDKR